MTWNSASRNYPLPGVIAHFRQTHPGARVTFGLGTSAEVANAVRSHRAEIGISRGFVAVPEIEAEPLIEDEIVIVGTPTLEGRRGSRDELEASTWISRKERSATRVIGDAALADLGIVPRHRLDLPSWDSIRMVVRHGQGIAAFSRLPLTEELEAGTLLVISFVPWKVRRTFSIVRIRDAALTPPAQQFLLMRRAGWGHVYSWASLSAQ